MRAENQVGPSASAAGAQEGNLVQLLIQRAQNASKAGVTHKKDGRWQDVSFGQVLDDVKALSAGLVAQGVKPGDRVALFANTSLMWIVADLAITAAQAITVPIYSSNLPDEFRYVIKHSETSFVFVDNDEKDAKQAGRLTRVRQKLAECPTVQKVIVFEGAVAGGQEVALADVMAQGREAHQANPASFEERVASVKSEDTNCLIYTSGTTGDPKGAILTHGNWTYQAHAVQAIGMMEPSDAVMLFLPLAHVFAQVVKAAWLSMGFRLIIAESVDKLMANIVETRPTVLPSVPRVFEKVYNTVVSNGTSAPGLKGRMARWAFKLFDEYVEAKQQGREYDGLAFTLAKKLVFTKVRGTLDEKLGGNMRLFVSGGAPLSRKIGYFFDLLGFKVVEGYGLTETAAPTNANRPNKIKIGTVGPAMPGTEVKIASDGEVLARGPCIMKGYYKNDTATAEVLEADGWFHTGDIGELDSDGYLRITDRKKDIIVNDKGDNVAPQKVEGMLTLQPEIMQAMIAGDRKPYMTAVIVPDPEWTQEWCARTGVKCDLAALRDDPAYRAAISAAVDRVNANLSVIERVRRFILADAPFTIENQQMTPSLKIRRHVLKQVYGERLDGLYKG